MFKFWLASIVPKSVRYYITNDAVAKCTSGKYSDTIVPELTCMDMLQRLMDDKDSK